MNDPNAYGFPSGEAAPPQPQYPPSLGGYKFSTDELRVLSECNNESFFKRSLPIGTALGLGTYGAIQRGMVRGNPRFGALPKVTLAVVVGYFVGKVSYQEQCAQKLMALPGSYIGQVLRDKKEGRGLSAVRPGAGGAAPPAMFGAGPADIYSDAGPGSSLNLDTDRPLFGDDAHVPNNDNSGRDAGAPAAGGGGGGPVLSYDELRRRNRGEYTDARQDPYRVEVPASRARPPSPPESTNKYGDTME